MQAETINCPMCGAATSTDASQCAFCGARLATIGCPKCFAMMFIGTKHCPRCGAAAVRENVLETLERKCPRCKSEMQLVSIGDSQVLECSSCAGLWLDVASFEKICADREQQAAILGTATLATANRSTTTTKVTYIPCPECSQLMNRANFARCSGVIIDLCKQHGIWFDRDELSRIVEFIKSGGLDVSRAKEKAALEAERQKLREERMANLHESSSFTFTDPDTTRISGIVSTKGLLKFLRR